MAVKQILGKVTVTPKGEYSSSETYKRLDIVTSNGQSYIAKVDNTGVDVTNTNTWLQLVEKPEKGIDYFTEEDIAQLVSMVTDDSESEFNEYYNGKVSDFDSNASSKTSEFNSNYDEKVESFNTIFDTSTDNFDGNYETKLSAFNENASTQTSTFNSVVEQATSDFNSNASTLTETFNTNASEKTSAFNINASEKTQEFNDNVDEKTEQITSQLDNYVQFDDYPSNEKAGVIKPSNNFMVDPSNGYVYAEALDATSYYENTDSTSFISKGTLENIKDDYVESSTPVKNLNNSLKDITPKNNAEGTDNTFDDGLESPLYALGGDGKSEQVVTTGKNKLQITTFNDGTKSKTLNGVTANINENGTISLSGTASAETQFYLTKNDFSLESGNGYFWCNSPSVNCRFEFVASIDGEEKYLNSYSTTPNTFNITSSFVYSGSTIIVASGTSTNVTLTPMVSNGTFTEYEPYTGGQPSPSPDYPQPINSIEGSVEFACRGKNLLKPLLLDNNILNGITSNTLDDGSISLNGTSTSDTYRSIATTNLKANTDYTLSVDSDTTNDIQIFCNVTATESGTNWIPINNKYTIFRVNNDIQNAIINIFIRNNTTVNKVFKVQLEQGTTATEYEPYIQPNEVTFNLEQEKLRSVGDVKDELVVDLDTGDYYKLKNIEHLELSIANMNNTSEDYPGWLNVPNIQDYFPNVNVTIHMLAEVKSNITTNNLSIGINTINQSNLWLEKGIFNLTQTQWKEQYPDLVFKLDYSIPSTETIKLGTLSAEDLAKLKTFKGYNNVTVNTNLGLMNIRFTYGLDIKKYVDNKIAELSAQMIKGE